MSSLKERNGPSATIYMLLVVLFTVLFTYLLTVLFTVLQWYYLQCYFRVRKWLLKENDTGLVSHIHFIWKFINAWMTMASFLPKSQYDSEPNTEQITTNPIISSVPVQTAILTPS